MQLVHEEMATKGVRHVRAHCHDNNQTQKKLLT